MKKIIIAITLCIVTMFSCFSLTACKKSKYGNKTVIKVGTYPGGVGQEWLTDAAERFALKYAETSFEKGKKGVYVEVTDSLTGSAYLDQPMTHDVYFTEVVDYYALQSKGKLADISDIISGDKSSLSEYGETGTIASKIPSSLNSFLTAKDGKYYGLPFYEGVYGFVYDADMFALNEWFFKEDGTFTGDEKSTGIDKIAGTYDDGLPRTYAEFSKLLDKIRGAGVNPFTFANESMTYFVSLLANYWADYEGYDKMSLNWSFNGTTDIVSSFNGTTPVITTTTINDSNIAELQKQPGKYYALSFLKDVLLKIDGTGKKNYIKSSDFKSAQLKFVTSCIDGDMATSDPVAMVVDGSWFENEAQMEGTFDIADSKDPRNNNGKEYRTTRNLGFLPIPMVDDSQATLDNVSKNANNSHKQTLLSSNDSFCFVSATTTGVKLDLAKEFVKFIHTEAELIAFNKKTSITRPFEYTISQTDLGNMSYFARTLYQIKKSSNIVYPYSNSQTYVNNSSKYVLGAWAWAAEVNRNTPSNPFVFLEQDSNRSVTAKDYFEGLYNYHK